MNLWAVRIKSARKMSEVNIFFFLLMNLLFCVLNTYKYIIYMHAGNRRSVKIKIDQDYLKFEILSSSQ